MARRKRKNGPAYARLSKEAHQRIAQLCEWSGKDAERILEEAVRVLHRQEACMRSVTEHWRRDQKWVIQARRLPDGNLLVPVDGQDRMIEIGPGHPEYNGWLPFAEEGPDPRRNGHG